MEGADALGKRVEIANPGSIGRPGGEVDLTAPGELDEGRARRYIDAPDVASAPRNSCDNHPATRAVVTVATVESLRIIARQDFLRAGTAIGPDMTHPEAAHMTNAAEAPGDGGRINIRRPIQREYTLAYSCICADASGNDQRAIYLSIIVKDSGVTLLAYFKGEARSIGRPGGM